MVLFKIEAQPLIPWCLVANMFVRSEIANAEKAVSSLRKDGLIGHEIKPIFKRGLAGL